MWLWGGRMSYYLLEHLLLLKVQIPPRPHRARPPVPGHYSTFAWSGINMSFLKPPTRVLLLLQERWQEVKGSSTQSHRPPATWDFKMKTIQTNQSHVVPCKKLPLVAALDTQGHNPIRPKPHNTNYCANNGTAPEWKPFFFLRGWIAKMKIGVLSLGDWINTVFCMSLIPERRDKSLVFVGSWWGFS